jgi:hypothetical protein
VKAWYKSIVNKKKFEKGLVKDDLFLVEEGVVWRLAVGTSFIYDF